MFSEEPQLVAFKRFSLRVLVPVCAALALLLWGAATVLEQTIIRGNDACGAAKVSRIFAGNRPNEIPILGSSRVEGGIIPDSLGPNFYNYGLSGIQENVLFTLLQAECGQRKNTPWLLINYDIDGFNYALGDPANYLTESDRPQIEKLMGEKYKNYFKIPFIKYYGYYEQYYRDYTDIFISGEEVHNRGFHLERHNPTEGRFDSVVAVRRKTPVPYMHYPELVAQTEALIAAHPERKFVYFIMPYHPEYLKVVTDTAASMAFIRAFAGRHPNVILLDFSRLPFPDDYFMDTSHLSLKGAQVFSKLLQEKLKEYGCY